MSVSGRSAQIHVAAASGDVSRIEYILAHSPDMVNATDRDGVSPLHYAAAGGHREAVQALLDKGAEIDAAAFSGTTPLYLAAAEGELATVRLLLQKGADVVKTDEMGCAPVHAAAGNGHIEIVKLLVNRGARPEALCRSLNAAELAYALGYDDTVTYLKSQGVKVRSADPQVLRKISKLRQSELIVNLQRLCTLQKAYHQKHHAYSSTFRDLGFAPPGNTRHALFLPDEILQPRIGGPFQLSDKRSSMAEAGEKGFTALAAGDVDGDEGRDVWLVNDAQQATNLEDDVEEDMDKEDRD